MTDELDGGIHQEEQPSGKTAESEGVILELTDSLLESMIGGIRRALEKRTLFFLSALEKKDVPIDDFFAFDGESICENRGTIGHLIRNHFAAVVQTLEEMSCMPHYKRRSAQGRTVRCHNRNLAQLRRDMYTRCLSGDSA